MVCKSVVYGMFDMTVCMVCMVCMVTMMGMECFLCKCRYGMYGIHVFHMRSSSAPPLVAGSGLCVRSYVLHISYSGVMFTPII